MIKYKDIEVSNFSVVVILIFILTIVGMLLLYLSTDKGVSIMENLTIDTPTISQSIENSDNSSNSLISGKL